MGNMRAVYSWIRYLSLGALLLLGSACTDVAEEQATPSTSTLYPFGEELPGILVKEVAEGYLFDGDIFIPEEHVDTLYTQAHIHRSSQRWPRGVMPYRISGDFSTSEQTVIHKAAQTLSELTNVTIRPHHGERSYVQIVKGGGCYSAFGHLGGVQTLSLDPQCVTVGVVMHEFGHALGLLHEHSRRDRDQYIRIHFDRVPDSHHGEYQIAPYGRSFGPYDYYSMMHYGPRYNSNKQPLFEVLDPTVSLENMGSSKRTAPSEGDIAAINALYPRVGQSDVTAPPAFRHEGMGASMGLDEVEGCIPRSLPQRVMAMCVGQYGSSFKPNYMNTGVTHGMYHGRNYVGLDGAEVMCREDYRHLCIQDEGTTKPESTPTNVPPVGPNPAAPNPKPIAPNPISPSPISPDAIDISNPDVKDPISEDNTSSPDPMIPNPLPPAPLNPEPPINLPNPIGADESELVDPKPVAPVGPAIPDPKPVAPVGPAIPDPMGPERNPMDDDAAGGMDACPAGTPFVISVECVKEHGEYVMGYLSFLDVGIYHKELYWTVTGVPEMICTSCK